MIYAIGYSDDPEKYSNPYYRKVENIIQSDWYFSEKAFVEFKNNSSCAMRRLRVRSQGSCCPSTEDSRHIGV